VLAVTTAQVVRFGADDALTSSGSANAPAAYVSVILALTWLAALRIFQTLDRNVIGSGSQEYSRVLTASLALFGALAIVDLLLRLNIARGYLALAFPIGTVGLLLSRWLWRQQLVRQRAALKNLRDVVIVGSVGPARPLLQRLMDQPRLGYRVVGICLPEYGSLNTTAVKVGSHSIPVLGTFEDVRRAVEHSGATAVAVASAEAMGHQAMQDLSWDLEGLDVDMLVAPGIVDVAGPRMALRPVEGLPLLHIEKPQYGAAQSVLKTSLDYVVAGTALMLVAPVMLATACAIKAHDGGPVFFRHSRVGKDGREFRVWKFRSMVQNADAQKASLQKATTDTARSIFYKSEDDPRITPIGKFIRKTSVDELPQLFNVLSRDMSVVGPRPLVPGEGSEIPNFVERRLLVKPGITGLWQVSGRSNLPEEDRIRLDLLYVENWSLMQDVMILWRTIRVVINKQGAY
jgi:exopolysaccharide biosynthesis polyprenyl glycosylphosphotransferase